MKTRTVEHEVTSNVGEQAEFKIKASGKAFKALIDGLYADKIQSITREIWTNALDAHIMAGCVDRPFEVSFPTAFDPSFRVRDFGISLTHDQVMHMYTTLFESTKEGSDDENGKWGLGSKSPFAYADSFSVTVVLDGLKRFYAAMIGGNGIPTINFMGAEETEEENGVEVSFPVDKADVVAFAKAARRVSHGFDVKPVVTNMIEGFSGWPSLQVLKEGQGWKMLNGSIEGYRSQAYAKMGCVLYPINADAMGDISAEEREVLTHTFVIDFAMGELEITMSREELSYGRNEPTVESIRKRVAAIIDDFRVEAAALFADCKTHWEACVLSHEIAKDHRLPEFFRRVYARYGSWNGKALTHNFTVLRGLGYEIMNFDSKAFSRVTVNYRPATAHVTIAAQKNTVFLFEDLTDGRVVKRSSARVRRWKESSRSKQAVWVRFYKRSAMTEMVTRLMDTFDGAEFIDIEDIELPAPVRDSGPRRPVTPRIFHEGTFDTRVEMDEDDFEEGGIYLSLERMIPITPRGADRPATVIALLRAVGAISQDAVIYGAPKSLQRRFEGDNWIDLYEFANQWLEDNGKDVGAMQRRETALTRVRTDDVLYFIKRYVDGVAVQSNSLILDAVTLFDTAAQEAKTNSDYIFKLARALGTSIAVLDGEDALQYLYDTTMAALRETYPMLELLAENVSGGDKLVDLVTQYVIMCDNVSQTNQNVQFQIAAE